MSAPFKLAAPEAAFWEKLFNTDFVYEPNCWQDCKNNCCYPGMTDAEFRFPAVWIFYMEAEFNFLRARGLLPRSIHKLPYHEIQLRLDHGFIFKGYWHRCEHSGECKYLKVQPPLFCKLCPFLPILDIGGKIRGIDLLNIFDVTLSTLNLPPRCSLVTDSSEFLNLWHSSRDFQELVTHPYILFHMMGAKIAVENYRRALSENSKMKNKSGASFWKAWEVEFITGRLFHKESLAQGLSLLLRQIILHYQ